MHEKNNIKELPVSERPYEKFLMYGPEGLSDADLLAILVNSGTSQYSSLDISKMLLKDKQGNLLNLYDYSYDELLRFPGIGKVKAIQLKAIAELSRRISQTDKRSKLTLDSPKSIAEYYMEQLRHENQEYVLCAYFDAKSRLLGDYFVSKGTSCSSYVVVSIILKKALEKNALKLVLLHNHPSGDPSPSQDDIRVTQKLTEGCRLLDLVLCDHVIIGDNRYYSFFEHNLM